MPDWVLSVVALTVLVMRPLGVLIAIPIFSSRALGGPMIRNGVMIAIALPMLPLQLAQAQATLALPGSAMTLFALQEIALGALIGFCAAIPFWAIDMAGTIIDTIRGSSMASVLNPMLGEQSSVFGILFTQVLGAIYMANGGFHTLLAALYGSYVTFPPMTPLHFSSSFPTFFGEQWQAMVELSVNFAMPAIVAMILVDIGLGLVNRTAQQLNVFFVAMPIKSAMALFVLAVGVTYGLLAYTARFSDFGNTVTSLLGTLR